MRTVNTSSVPKKQQRMLKRLMRDSLTAVALRGAPHKDAAWDNMLGKAGLKRP